jgi:hypothetical protein
VLVAAAVCPHPPLLVPGVGAGASGELDQLRVACDAAVLDLLAAEPTLVVVVGGAPVVGPFGDGAWGSLAGFGVRVPVGSGPGEPTLPLSLTLGRWLVSRADGEVRPLLFGVEPDAGADRCLALGEVLSGRADRVALLVMGDGSARRSVKGPGGLDPAAEPFDAAVADALAAGDPDALAALDPAHAADLLAAGRAPWQVLAGAARGAGWQGTVTWTGSPYGVTYLVATWTLAG